MSIFGTSKRVDDGIEEVATGEVNPEGEAALPTDEVLSEESDKSVEGEDEPGDEDSDDQDDPGAEYHAGEGDDDLDKDVPPMDETYPSEPSMPSPGSSMPGNDPVARCAN